jgi:hypothetical protein
MEVRSDVGASLAAALADEPRFEIGKPDANRPLVSTVWVAKVNKDRNRKRAAP